MKLLINQIGHKLEVKPDYDKGVAGRWAACHAEKQLAMLGANSMAVSKYMCPDCQEFFSLLSKVEGRTIVVRDPSSTRVFCPDKSNVVIPNNLLN